AGAVRRAGPRSRVSCRRVEGVAPCVRRSTADAAAQDRSGLCRFADHALPLRHRLSSCRAEAARCGGARHDGDHRRHPDVLLLYENRRHAPIGVRHGCHRARRPHPRAGPLAGCGKTRLLMPGHMKSSTTMRATASEEARMRGEGPGQQPHMWSYVPLEQRIPTEHPLRPLRAMVDAILRDLSPQFDELYSKVGRPSIPPEHLLRALLLQVLYSVRSERLLMEQLDYNLLFRWFVGLAMDDPIWDATVFTKNRERLLRGDIARAFFKRVRAQAEQRGLLSDEHFTVDGTLIDAWASLKSFKRKDAPPTAPDDPGNPTVNFHGERRSNATHASTTDPQALLYRKRDRREAKLCYQGHVLMENRHGLAVDGCLTPANGYGERGAALEMIGPRATTRRITLAADKGYDSRDFVGALRLLQVTPHVAQNISNRSSANDRRTTRHAGYEVSQQKRKRIEEIFGWLKTIGLMRQTRHRGRRRVGWMFVFSLAVYN